MFVKNWFNVLLPGSDSHSGELGNSHVGTSEHFQRYNGVSLRIFSVDSSAKELPALLRFML